MNYLNNFCNSRLLSTLLLGFVSGLPVALTSSTLQAWFTASNMNLMIIGAVSLIGLPYTFKFFWAPIFDYFKIPYFGKRKGWLIIFQVMLVFLIAMLAQLNPQQDTLKMCVFAFLVSFCSASLDVSINAYQSNILFTEERGLGASYYIFSYRIAGLLSGGLALVFASFLGWTKTYELMAFLILCTAFSSFLIPAIEDDKNQTTFLSTTYDALIDLIHRDKVLFILLFILLYKIGDAFALQLMTTFLLDGLHFTLTEVGLAYKAVSFIGLIAGAFIGGIFLTHWSIYNALLRFGLAQALSNLMFIILAIVGKNFLLMISTILIENFCSGLSTAAFLAFFMALCHQKYTATQFALFSAIASIGRVFLGPLAAFFVQHFGWTQFYIWSFALSFPGLFVLILLKEKVLVYAPIPDR